MPLLALGFALAPVPANAEVIKVSCPDINQLKLEKDLYWVGPGDWKSYSESFVKEISYFAGAQWVGVNVGKIICLYKGKDHTMFPVAIERETLVTQPTGGKWGPDEGGYVNCRSQLIRDCVFQIETAAAPPKDLYKELESFKQ